MWFCYLYDDSCWLSGATLVWPTDPRLDCRAFGAANVNMLAAWRAEKGHAMAPLCLVVLEHLSNLELVPPDVEGVGAWGGGNGRSLDDISRRHFVGQPGLSEPPFSRCFSARLGSCWSCFVGARIPHTHTHLPAGLASPPPARLAEAPRKRPSGVAEGGATRSLRHDRCTEAAAGPALRRPALALPRLGPAPARRGAMALAAPCDDGSGRSAAGGGESEWVRARIAQARVGALGDGGSARGMRETEETMCPSGGPALGTF